MKKQNLFRSVCLLLVIVMAFSFAACGSKEAAPAEAAPAEAAASGGASAEDAWTSITVGSTYGTFVGSLDAMGWTTTRTSYCALNMIYECMFTLDPNTQEYTSAILSDWGWNDDTYTSMFYTLKDGVTFSNGDAADGEDLLYSMNRNAQISNSSASFRHVDWDNTYVADDGMTVVVGFLYPYEPGYYLFARLMNQAWIEANGGNDVLDWYDPAMVCGTGPYKITEYTQDISMTMQLRDDWWGQADYGADLDLVDEVNCVEYSDETTMMVDYENGILDVALMLSENNVLRVQDDPSLGTAGIVNICTSNNIVMDAEGNEYLGDERVRQAICYGIDVPTMVDSAYGVLGTVAHSMISSSFDSFVDGLYYEYNPEKAKELLAETGYTPEQLTFKVLSTSTASQVAVWEIFQQYMQEIGITIDMEIFDEATCVEMWFVEGNADFMLQSYAGGNSTRQESVELNQYLSTGIFPVCNREDPIPNDIYNEAIATGDPEKNAELWGQFQQYFYDNFLVVPINESYHAYAFHTEKLSACPMVSVMNNDFRFFVPAA